MEDDFAQSREPDDLFSDDIEPTEPEATSSAATAQAHVSNSAPSTAPKNQQRHGAAATNQGHRGGRRGGHNGGATTARAEQPNQPKPTSPIQNDSTNTNPSPVKAAPSEEPRVTSVRGDRSATGPAKPTKKTEAELSELMKSMQLKNAAKTEAHARAEKDQASFLHREQQAAAKRVEERKAIREQDMERAKNRERKIKAQGGREWDSEKQESDIVDRSRGDSSMYTRGVHGAVSGGRGSGRGGLASSRYGADEELEEAQYEGRGGRGGRGRGRGRSDYQGGRGDGPRGGRGGRGRGGYFNGANAAKQAVPITGESDFPALPTPANKTTASDTPKVEAKENPVASPSVREGDWADEMATSVEKT